MRSFTVFTFLISFSLLSFSQSDFRPGYVITNDDDTLTGFIDYRGDDYNSVNCYFRPTMEDSRILYAPGEIKSYKFLDGRLYVSKQVEIDKVMRDVFLEQLVKGRANLYALAPGVVAGRTDRYAHSTKLFFIETEEKGIQVLENTESLISGKDGSGVLMDNQFVEYSKKYVKEGNEYIGYLKLYFQDQFQLMDEVDRVEFNQNDLIDITTKYHELACPGEACIVYSKPGPEIQNSLVFIAGTHINRVKLSVIDYYGDEDIFLRNTAPGFLAGIQLETYTHGMYERLFSRLSVFYTQVEHRDEADGSIYLKYQTLNIGLTINYMYPRYRLKPFAGIGALYLQSFGNEEGYIRYPSIVYNPVRKSFGPVGDLGLYYKINKRLGCKLQAEYFWDAFRAPEDPRYYSRANNVNITLGLVMALGKE